MVVVVGGMHVQSPQLIKCFPEFSHYDLAAQSGVAIQFFFGGEGSILDLVLVLSLALKGDTWLLVRIQQLLGTQLDRRFLLPGFSSSPDFLLP